jgi:hypothetical protein
MFRQKYFGLITFTVVLGFASLSAVQDKGYAGGRDPFSEKKQTVKLIGYNDLQGREALQVTCKSDPEHGNGEYVYVGFHAGLHLNLLTGRQEYNGTMIIDISDPANPTTVAHIPNDMKGANSRAVQVVYDYGPDGRDYLIRNYEGGKVYKFEIFDITGRDQNPPIITKAGEITGTPANSGEPGCGGTLQSSAHKGWWSPDSKLFYTAANEPGFRGGKDSSHLIIWNLADPANPVFIGRAWLPGQKSIEPDPRQPLNLHHPIVDEENGRLYGGYHRGGNVVSFDISGILASPLIPSDPVLAWHVDTEPPGRGTHTVAPIVYNYPEIPNFWKDAFPRRYVLVIDEAERSCDPVRHKLYMFDITSETAPFPVETWQVPDGDFCEKGGRFGPHQFAETVNGELNNFKDKIAWVTYFNAGIRVIDISDPYNIKEVGYYIPQPNENTSAAEPRQPPVIQMNDIDIDHRGLAYASDRMGTGLFVLKYITR